MSQDVYFCVLTHEYNFSTSYFVHFSSFSVVFQPYASIGGEPILDEEQLVRITLGQPKEEPVSDNLDDQFGLDFLRSLHSMKNLVSASSRSANEKKQPKRRPISAVSSASSTKTAKASSDDSKKHFDPNQLKHALVSGRKSVQGVRNLGKSWFEILDNASLDSSNNHLSEHGRSRLSQKSGQKTANISEMRQLSDSDDSCFEELDYDTSKFFEVENVYTEEDVFHADTNLSSKHNTKRTTFSANLSRRHFVRASTAKSRIQTTNNDETIVNSDYVDEQSFLSEDNDDSFYEDTKHHVTDLEESVNVTSHTTAREPEVATIVRRPKSDQLFRPFTPSFHINHNYNRSNSALLGRKDSENRRATVEERNETLYKQLCVLLWIFNNLSVDAHHKYTPIATCFSHVCPGGQKVPKAKLAKKKAEEQRWQSDIVARKPAKSEEKNENEDPRKLLLAPLSIGRMQQPPSSAASQRSVVSIATAAPKVVIYKPEDASDSIGASHAVHSVDEPSAASAILEEVEEESFVSESSRTGTTDRSYDDESSRSEHSNDTVTSSKSEKPETANNRVPEDSKSTFSMQPEKTDEPEENQSSTSRIQTPIVDEDGSLKNDEDVDAFGVEVVVDQLEDSKHETAVSGSEAQSGPNLDTHDSSAPEGKTGNDEVDNAEDGTLTELVSLEGSDSLSQSSLKKVSKKRPPVNRKARRHSKEDETLKLPSGVIADNASKVPERMKSEWQQIKLECGLSLRDILAQHKRVQREVSLSKLQEIGNTLGEKQSTSVEFNAAMRRVRYAAQLVYEKDSKNLEQYVEWYQTLMNNLPDTFISAAQNSSRPSSVLSTASSFLNDVTHDVSSQSANHKMPLSTTNQKHAVSHYVKLLAGLEQFGRVGAIPSALITGAALKRFLLREAKLRSWELCDPNVRPAIDFFCEHVAKLNKMEFFDWLVAYCPRAAAIESMSLAENKRHIVK